MLKNLEQKVNLNESPTIILVRPQLGENIGAVARAMLNFGLSDLRVVRPRDAWPNQHAIAVASGAGIILENAKIFESTQEACSDLNFVFAATARSRDLLKEITSPKTAVTRSRQFINTGQRVGMMFGPERAGLNNDDIRFTQSIIHVPINPQFSSLNLAQCVVLLAYEWFSLTPDQEVTKRNDNVIKFASLMEVEYLRSSLLKHLDATNYFWPRDKEVSLRANLTNLLGRLALTSADIKTLHGIIKALTKGKTNDY